MELGMGREQRKAMARGRGKGATGEGAGGGQEGGKEEREMGGNVAETRYARGKTKGGDGKRNCPA